MQPFPHPNDATHKIWSRLADWLQRYSSSKVWNFCHSRASKSKMSGLIRPEIKLVQAFMPVLVTSNFDDDSIKNERASMETVFSHYNLWEIFRHSRAAKSVISRPICPKFEPVRDFMHVLVTCKYKMGQIKDNRGTHKIWSRLANLFQRYSSLKVWTTDDGPLVYYKLTLRASGSGELIKALQALHDTPPLFLILLLYMFRHEVPYRHIILSNSMGQSAWLHGLNSVDIFNKKMSTAGSNPYLFSNSRLENDFDIRGQNTVDWNMILTSIRGQNSIDNPFNWIWYILN